MAKKKNSAELSDELMDELRARIDDVLSDDDRATLINHARKEGAARPAEMLNEAIKLLIANEDYILTERPADKVTIEGRIAELVNDPSALNTLLKDAVEIVVQGPEASLKKRGR